MITFDDGYLDNWVYAHPILHKYGMHAVVFVVTGWMGENHFAQWPVFAYAVVMLCAAIAFTILARTLIAANGGAQSNLARALGAAIYMFNLLRENRRESKMNNSLKSFVIIVIALAGAVGIGAWFATPAFAASPLQASNSNFDAVLALAGPAGFGKALVAYEPVWAIGTGLTPTTADVAEAHGFIRKRLASRHPTAADGIRILYGGSVKPSNAKELMSVTDVDGALVGGASLLATDFLGIAAAYR